MRTVLASGTLLLLAVAAFTANPADGPHASATKNSGTASQDAAKQSSTASPGTGTSSASKRKIPCKSPENASLCYWMHGRLSVYEGAVPYHIWKIGTRRLLGVFSGPSHYPAMTDDDVFNPEFPAELDRAYEADNRRHKKATGSMWAIPPPVFADFEVCPLRPEEKGERQPVCIESAKNIFVQDDDY
jgi:hypothetical protein